MDAVVDFVVDDFGATAALLVSLTAALVDVAALVVEVAALVVVVAALGSLTAAALVSLTTGAFAWEAAALVALVAAGAFTVLAAFLGSDAALALAGLINRESVLFAGAETGAPFVCELSELAATGFAA